MSTDINHGCMYGKILNKEQSQLRTDISQQLDKIIAKLDEYSKNHTDLRLDVHQLKIVTKANTRDIQTLQEKQERTCKELRVEFDDFREDTVNTKLKQANSDVLVKVLWGVGGTLLLLATQFLSAYILKMIL